MAIEPSFVAGKETSDPPNPPIGVLATAAMYTSTPTKRRMRLKTTY